MKPCTLYETIESRVSPTVTPGVRAKLAPILVIFIIPKFGVLPPKCVKPYNNKVFLVLFFSPFVTYLAPDCVRPDPV